MNSKKKKLSWYTHHAEDTRGDGFLERGLVLYLARISNSNDPIYRRVYKTDQSDQIADLR